MPVHATVITFGCEIVPQDTKTGGKGDSIVPGFHVIFVILYCLFSKIG